ncbi:MAG: 16S rRNA (cytosine(1402)-N(4))-methyltransferase RsmH [Lachnospiraceae bacterium]|nr:16S rRNA (cytosine(1402)-N(4))-methyltransferase RsmH [Lachnospiraceae bacterium]
MEFRHTPVLLAEVLEGLAVRPDGRYVDGTTGGAGHSSRIAERLGEKGKLFCFDQDAEALAAAKERLAEYGDKVVFFHDNFENAVRRLKEEGVEEVDGILLDLGVSSYQLDNAERGFSYRYDAPLDMRMNREQKLSAWEVVNQSQENELFRILRDYGEEKFAKNIAKNIVKARAEKPIESTFELNEIIKASMPARMRQDGHPSKRSFQAIRIACNRELDVLENAITPMIDMLAEGGRLCIISFHSLEDRIVKEAFRNAEHPCICPPGFPQCACGRKPKGKCIGKRPITAGAEEAEENPRSKPAKLRIFEKGESN